MGLPIMASSSDAEKMVGYLKTKSTGATIDEVKAVLGGPIVDGRKLAALVDWGIIARDDSRLRLMDFGKDLARAGKDEDEKRAVYRNVVKRMAPYLSAVEWMFHQNFEHVTSPEVGAQWLENNKKDVGNAPEKTMTYMTVCFFHIAEAAGLGSLRIGRRGQATRLLIDKPALGQFIGEASLVKEATERPDQENAKTKTICDEKTPQATGAGEEEEPKSEGPQSRTIRVFISHGKNMEIVDQIKTMLDLGGLEFEVVIEKETTAIPVPEKVLSAMRNCTAAVICVTADEKEKRDDGTYAMNQNVLIEIGAAFVLYDKKVVLVWDKDVEVPSNLQGLYRCEFSGNELSWSSGMKLMKALSNFRQK